MRIVLSLVMLAALSMGSTGCGEQGHTSEKAAGAGEEGFAAEYDESGDCAWMYGFKGGDVSFLTEDKALKKLVITLAQDSEEGLESVRGIGERIQAEEADPADGRVEAFIRGGDESYPYEAFLISGPDGEQRVLCQIRDWRGTGEVKQAFEVPVEYDRRWLENFERTGDIVRFDDIDFDGYRDIVLRYSAGAENRFSYGLLWREEDGAFQNCQAFLALCDPRIDSGRYRILCRTRGGEADTYEQYRYEADNYIMEASTQIGHSEGPGSGSAVEILFRAGEPEESRELSWEEADRLAAAYAGGDPWEEIGEASDSALGGAPVKTVGTFRVRPEPEGPEAVISVETLGRPQGGESELSVSSYPIRIRTRGDSSSEICSQILTLNSDYWHFDQSDVTLEDFNFDGHPDLSVCYYDYRAYHLTRVFLWDPEAHRYSVDSDTMETAYLLHPERRVIELKASTMEGSFISLCRFEGDDLVTLRSWRTRWTPEGVQVMIRDETDGGRRTLLDESMEYETYEARLEEFQNRLWDGI